MTIPGSAERDDLWMTAQAATHVFIGSAADCWVEFARQCFSDAQHDPTLAFGERTTIRYRERITPTYCLPEPLN